MKKCLYCNEDSAEFIYCSFLCKVNDTRMGLGLLKLEGKKEPSLTYTGSCPSIHKQGCYPYIWPEKCKCLRNSMWKNNKVDLIIGIICAIVYSIAGFVWGRLVGWW